MDATRKDKIIRFLNDPVMEDAVHSIVLRVFLKKHETRDVQTLAAERIAIDLLDEAWKELRSYKSEAERDKREVGNVGV